MKALKIADIFSYDKKKYFENHSDDLNFTVNPSKKQGVDVILIRDVQCYKKGQKGIVKNFSEQQILNLHEEYNRNLKLYKYKKNRESAVLPLPDLNATYDFHPIVKKDGKLEISLWHAYITRFDFRIIKPKQLQLFES